MWQVKKKNKATFEAEKKFMEHNNYVKIYGNHDLYWNNSPFASMDLKDMYGEKIKVYEGVMLKSLVRSLESGVNKRTQYYQRTPNSLFFLPTATRAMHKAMETNSVNFL